MPEIQRRKTLTVRIGQVKVGREVPDKALADRSSEVRHGRDEARHRA